MRTLIAFVLAAAVATPAAAQQWPARQITLVVNSGPAGPTDVTARAIKDRMQEILGQPVVIDNRVGAGGSQAAQQLKTAPPDGYTLLVSGIGPMAFTPFMSSNPDVQIDPVRELTPVGQLVYVPGIWAASPALGAETMPEAIRIIKANPGKFSYGSPGIGTPGHLAGEWLKQLAGLDMTHVPYRAAPQVAQAMMAGEVHLYMTTPVVLPQIKAGRLKGLMVMDKVRLPQAPEIPTAAEAGMPDFLFAGWFGLFAPPGTPRPIVDRVYAAAVEAMQDPKAKEVLNNVAFNIAPVPPDEFARQITEQRRVWKGVIEAGKIRAE